MSHRIQKTRRPPAASSSAASRALRSLSSSKNPLPSHFRASSSSAASPAFVTSSSSDSANPRLPSSTRASTLDASTSRHGSSLRRQQDEADELGDLGVVAAMPTTTVLSDVLQTLPYVRDQMFDEIPMTGRTGFNSTRLAEILRFRQQMAPLVTPLHVHALIDAPTRVEREIARELRAGALRRITVPRRGVGMASLSEALVLTRDWILRMEQSGLDTRLQGKYISYIQSDAALAPTVVSSTFTEDEANGLVRAGFLTAAVDTEPALSGYTAANTGSVSTATSMSSIARAASGSLQAVGGLGAVHVAGGGGGGGALQTPGARKKTSKTSSTGLGTDSSSSTRGVPPLRLALPNTGAFLKLVEAARDHLVHILERGTRHHEAPLYLLRESWDGGLMVLPNRRPRNRDPFAVGLPAKMAKWRDFQGLRFDWALAEALGAGMVELFDTGSVGLGVRLTS